MRNYFQLTQFDPGDQRINTAPVQNALENWGRRSDQFRQEAQQAEERTYQRGRESKADARQETVDQFKIAESLAKRADAIGRLAPEQRGPAWTQFLGTHKRYFPTATLDPEDMDPIQGPQRYAAAFGGIARDPREDKLADVKLLTAQAELAKAQRGDSGRVGMQPVYGIDDAGNVVVMQPSSTGELVQSKLPPGVRVDPGLAAGAKARATAEGKWEGGAEQRNTGKTRLAEQLKGMVGNYLTLDQRGGIVNPDRGGMENLQARARSSSVGQMLGGAVGTEEQSIRNRIENVRPLLMQGIMQASGMSARALDSNRELDFYLRAATDPTQDIYSNLVAIDVLDKTYGLGNVLAETVPPEILARVQRDSARAIQSRPIPGQVNSPATQAPQAQPPVEGARQAPDGNWYVPDPNRPGKFLRVE